MQALVIAADSAERDFYAYALRQAGLSVVHRPSWQDAIREWPEAPAEIVLAVVDNAAPIVEAVRRFRTASDSPVILLMEAPSQRAQVEILAAGADLVLAHPAGPSLLVAYVQNLLRRSTGVPSFALPKLDLPPVRLDPSTRRVQVDEASPIPLTQLEFRLLYFMMTHRGQVVPWEVIVERVWGYSESGSRELVRGLVSRLRSKLGSASQPDKFIKTVTGVGYLFDTQDE